MRHNKRQKTHSPVPQPAPQQAKQSEPATNLGPVPNLEWHKIPYDPTPEPTDPTYPGGENNSYLIEAKAVREAMKVPGGAEIDFQLCVLNGKKEARVRHFTEMAQIEQYQDYNKKGKQFRETYKKPLSGTHLLEADRQALETQAQMIEAEVATLPHRLREAWQDGTDGYDDMGWGQDGAAFAPIIGGPISHQLYLFDFLKMCSRGFWHRNHDPIASRICDIFTDYIIGKGVEFQHSSPIVTEWWQGYMDKYKVNERVKSMYSDSLHNGNMLAHFTDDPYDPSNIKMNIIDPSTVWEIVTNPSDIFDVYYYHQQYPTQYQTFTNPGISGQKYIVRQIPASQVLHIKHHAVSNEKWGRSILFPIFDELKRLKDYYNSKTLKAIIDSNMVIKFLLMMTQQQQDSMATMISDAKKSLMKPMGVIQSSVDPATGKPHIDVQIEQSKSGADGKSELGGELTIRAGVGVGLPPEFLGSGGTASRATAIERTSPTYKMFEAHQDMVEKVLQELFKRAFRRAQDTNTLPREQTRKAVIGDIFKLVAKGKLVEAASMIGTVIAGGDITEPLDNKIRFILPQIISDDRDKYMAALGMAFEQKTISHKTLGNYNGASLGIKDYNYEEEMAQIKEESESSAEAQVAQVGNMYPAGKPAEPSARAQARQELKR